MPTERTTYILHESSIRSPGHNGKRTKYDNLKGMNTWRVACCCIHLVGFTTRTTTMRMDAVVVVSLLFGTVLRRCSTFWDKSGFVKTKLLQHSIAQCIHIWMFRDQLSPCWSPISRTHQQITCTQAKECWICYTQCEQWVDKLRCGFADAWDIGFLQNQQQVAQTQRGQLVHIVSVILEHLQVHYN